ncbi:MAG: hypothetical protein JW795_06250 [Chitinivibrionales bacterium]|nr:hypothetical protein [Chitinivibrionales bacterium]
MKRKPLCSRCQQLSGIKVKSMVLRNMYWTMLLAFEKKQIRDFWSQVSLYLGMQDKPEMELYAALLNGGFYLPFERLVDIYDCLERFLLDNGWTLPQFTGKMFNTFSMYPSHVLLAENTIHYWHYIMQYLRGNESYLTFLSMLDNFFKIEVPNSCLRVLHWHQDERFFNAMILLAFDKSLQVKTYFEVNDWLITCLRATFESSVGFGDNGFLKLRSDCRTIEMLTDDYPIPIEYGAEGIFSGGRLIARKVDFHDFLRSTINNDIMEVPHSTEQCFAVLETVCCPVRRRPVLYEGCVYGAPFYSMQVRVELLHRKPVDDCDVSEQLKRIAEVKNDRESIRRLLKCKHDQIIEYTGDRQLVFHYHRNIQKIFFDNKEFVRGKQAVIFYKIISSFAKTGKDEFFYQELTADADLYLDPKHPNLSVRIDRLTATIGRLCPSLHLNRFDKGRIYLKTALKVSVSEE